MQGPCWEGGLRRTSRRALGKSRRYASIWWWEKVDVQKEAAAK